ncbi:hypothetical protein PVAND_010302 [Polypedilum vanderplanki]|uniref:Rab-GAP TBC domain-containing protein n=1 Tax=Polypedilum vanderplanki TaxID=319348 RepID=A0A9J6CF57_POLVA|nr:hypothetical protein PVAND_010302 [Polypedilum vanderplanki]
MDKILGTVKHSLKLNHERNGLFLKIHHEIEKDNEKEKIEFVHFDICDTNEIIAAVDNNGNLFVFNLNEKCFWQLMCVSIDDIKIIKFLSVNASKHNLLIGNKSGFIYEIEINSGKTVRCIRAFADEINQLLCSLSNIKTVVASTSRHIKIYEYDKFVKKFEFSFPNEMRIKFIKLVPHDSKLLVILQNDTICILNDALKLIRHFDPLRERKRFLRKTHHKIEMMNYVKDIDDDITTTATTMTKSSSGIVGDDDDDKIIKSVTRDYQNGVVTDITFDSNGNFFVVAFSDNNSIMLCSAMMWDVRRVIAYPDFYIKQCQFVSYSSSLRSNSNLLLTLTSNGNLMLVCMSDLNSQMLIDMNNVFSKKVVQTQEKRAKKVSSAFSDEQHCIRKGLYEIQMKMKETMPKGRLLAILKEFGEYPEKFRPMMWKTLLQLPENCESFAALLRRELNPSVSNYDKRFSLVDHKALNNLKQIMSCLAHWSPVFSSIKYLPKFIFPFVKFSRGDLLFCFELVATLFLNHCQMWFEYAPTLQTPYNYLNLIENVLMRVDPKLYDFYKSKDITSEHYALPLMESAFSEIFDEHTWMQLWDHIVSNEPSFLLFVIVAINASLRTTILKMENTDSIKQIFYEPNYINFKKLMKKAHAFMRKCTSSVHPRLTAIFFVPLSQGEYQKFEQYTQGTNLISANVTEVDALRREQKALDRKLAEIENFEKAMESRMEVFLIDEENQRRMKEIESKFAKALDEEEQRIIYQRKLLLLNTKKAREKEIEMIIQMKNAFLQNKVEAGKKDLEMILHNIEKQRVREEIEMQMAEENLKLKEIALQIKSLNIDEEGGKCANLQEKYKGAMVKLLEQHEKFMRELNQLESSSAQISSPSTTISHNSENATSITTASYEGFQVEQPEVDVIERTFHDLQEEYNHWSGMNVKNDDCVRNMKRLNNEIEKLEGEINSLLMNLGGNYK